MRPLHSWAARAAAGALFGLPSLSHAEALLTPARIFGDSAPLQKLVILMLVAAILAAVCVAAEALARGRRGGLAFVSGLRLGGPLLGLFGAAYSTLNGFVGLANVPVTPPLRVIAPGVAESLFVFGLGILAGILAVVACWAIEARSAPAAKG